MSEVATASIHSKSWYIAMRWQEYEGELRTCLLRAAFVLAFYSIHLLNYFQMRGKSEGLPLFHWRVTGICSGWLFLCLAIFVAIQSKYLPSWLKYASTSIDLTLITMVAWIGHGTQSPVINAYFVVIALSGLRFHLGLVWFATIGAVLEYICLVLKQSLIVDVRQTQFSTLDMSILIISLIAMGIVTGQWIRSARVAAIAYESRAGRLNDQSELENQG